jgi:hypothetical protein
MKVTKSGGFETAPAFFPSLAFFAVALLFFFPRSVVKPASGQSQQT